jgi:hypothetical protein
VRKLVARADVLVENFVSGKLASMGLGWEDCRKINPRLIYASITGPWLFASNTRQSLTYIQNKDMAKLARTVQRRGTTLLSRQRPV